MMKQIIVIITLTIGIGALFLGPMVGKQQIFANNLPSLGGTAGSTTQTNSIPADTGNMFGSGNTNTAPGENGGYENGWKEHMHNFETFGNTWELFHHHHHNPADMAWNEHIHHFETFANTWELFHHHHHHMFGNEQLGAGPGQ
jgi:hypothetical protein